MLEKGDLIGVYSLVRFLGRGQFGEVWLAEKQLQLSSKKVRHALKFLLNAGDEINLQAAEAELDTWIEASGHPNVISVLDMLQFRGYFIIVSEFAEGGSLKAWLKQNGGKAPSVEQALEMMVGILHGIEHLHNKNVVHRDLKPDNILLQGSFPRITDFGISRIVSTGSMSTRAMGSPAYMSPESFNGNKAPQNDIWSAGVILYEMLAGTYPFFAENTLGLIKAIQVDEIIPLPAAVLPELRAVVETALEKDREKRFQTARDMRLAVENVIYRLKSGTTNTRQEIFDTRKWAINDISADETVPAETPSPDLNITVSSGEMASDRESPVDETTARTAYTHDLTRTGFVNFGETKHESLNPSENSGHEQNRTVSDGAQKVIDRPTGRRFEPEQGRRGRRTDYGLIIAAVVGSIVLVATAIAFFVSSRTPAANSSFTDTSAPKSTPAGETAGKTVVPSGMVYIPGGTFMMGRNFADYAGKMTREQLYVDEEPAHPVTVGPFFIDIYEVTNEQYAEFVRATNHRPPGGWKDGRFPARREKFPVVNIEFDDAAAYARWAGKRLPTEEEWEFAARGTDNRLYPWGNEWNRSFANVENRDLAEVGSFKAGASPFGVHDMVGNAWEWTSSDFKAYPNGSLTKEYSGKSNLKTLRGNTITAGQHLATATFRLGYGASGERDYSRAGFRCAKDIAQ